MTSRLTRYGAVAAVAAVIILGLTFIEGKNKKAGKAWAIEQTIAALQDVRSLFFAGVINNTHQDNPEIPEGTIVPTAFELWGTTNDGKTGADLLLDTRAAGQMIVKHENVVYRYHPGRNTVYINNGDHFQISPWPGPDLFEKAKATTTDWKEDYRKDEKTGRDSVFVQCASENQSFWFQFDVETKLPVRLKQWRNGRWEGSPYFDVQRCVYDPEIPNDKFDFKIPPGAKVIDERKETGSDQDKK